MSAHTPGPWRAAPWNGHAPTTILAGAGGEMPTVIADCMGNGQHSEQARREAARIVACVNACEGMDDPAAEIARLKAAVASVASVSRP